MKQNNVMKRKKVMKSYLELSGQGRPLCEAECIMTRSSQVSHVNIWEQDIPSGDDNKDKSSEGETSLFMK